MDHSVARTGGSDRGQFVEGQVGVVHHPQQHRQAQRRYPAHRGAEPGQLRRDVAGGGTVQIGQHQHPVATVDLAQRGTRLRKQQFDVAVAAAGAEVPGELQEVRLVGTGEEPALELTFLDGDRARIAVVDLDGRVVAQRDA